MGTLQDELLKARLAGRKQQKKAEHQKRVKRTELGREGLAAEQQEKERALAARQEAKRRQDRELERERHREQEKLQGVHRLRDLIAREALAGRVRGPRRFHYVDREGRIPFLEVSDEVGDKLVRGELAILETVEKGISRTHLLPRRVVAEIRELDAEAVRFWNR